MYIYKLLIKNYYVFCYAIKNVINSNYIQFIKK